MSIRVGELFDRDVFGWRLRRLARSYKAQYGELLQYDVEKEIESSRVCCEFSCCHLSS